MAENKLTLKQLKQAIELVDNECPNDDILQALGGLCNRDCLECWRKAVNYQLREKEEVGE